ncbi:D-glucuronyl C5-epimerase family protein [Microbacterium sp. NPDC055521]
MTEIPHVDRSAFHRSGYPLHDVVVLPYEHQGMDYVKGDVILDLFDPDVELDEEGVALWRAPDGTLAHHPVTVTQYALAALGAYGRTGDRRYESRALAGGARLLKLADEVDDVLWFSYRFPHTYYDVTMPVPWWSGLAQGQALSLFTRLWQRYPDDERWQRAAVGTFRSFRAWRALGVPWITTMDAHGYLWFEEYAADVEPLLVVNGHVFALYGLYEYARHTGDSHARDLFDGGATTVHHYLDTFRVPGGVSYYCVREGYCQRPEWQNASYHPIHIQQLTMLGEMTGDDHFTEAARAFALDA